MPNMGPDKSKEFSASAHTLHKVIQESASARALEKSASARALENAAKAKGQASNAAASVATVPNQQAGAPQSGKSNSTTKESLGNT